MVDMDLLIFKFKLTTRYVLVRDKILMLGFIFCNHKLGLYEQKNYATLGTHGGTEPSSLKIYTQCCTRFLPQPNPTYTPPITQ